MVDRFPVEVGHIMLFARAVGDINPIYYSDEAAKQTEPGGMIAPPTFVQSSAQFEPDYGLRPKIGERWFGSGKAASGSNAEPPANWSAVSERRRLKISLVAESWTRAWSMMLR